MPSSIWKLNEYDWLHLATLIDNGNTLAQSLFILGIDLKGVYENSDISIEELLMQGGKTPFHENLRFFIKVTSLSNAVYASLNLVKFMQNMRKEIVRQCAYPVFIFFFSMVSIILFSHYIIPQLLSGFDVQVNTLMLKSIFFFEYVGIFLFGMIVFLILFVILLKVNHQCHLLIFRKCVRYISLCRQYISYYLSGYLKCLYECGLNTKDSFLFLMQIKHNTFIYYVVQEILNDLNQGICLQESILENQNLEKMFKHNFMIGSNNQNFLGSIQSYMDLQKQQWSTLMRKVSLIVQCVSYSVVGILVICVYQIMMIPLEMLKQF